MTTARSAALTTAMGVIYRVHGDTTNFGTIAQPTAATGLAELDVAVLFVANTPNGRATFEMDKPHLARWKPQGCPVTLLGQELGPRTSGTAHLCSATDLQLDRVHLRTDRNAPKRKTVSRANVRVSTGDDSVSYVQTLGRENVVTSSVGVVEQRQTRTTIRVVFDRCYPSRNPEDLAAEVNNAVTPLMTPTSATNGDSTRRVSASPASSEGTS